MLNVKGKMPVFRRKNKNPDAGGKEMRQNDGAPFCIGKIWLTAKMLCVTITILWHCTSCLLLIMKPFILTPYTVSMKGQVN